MRWGRLFLLVALVAGLLVAPGVARSAPQPVGYSPSLIPGWTDPQAPAFGILRVEPTQLRVLDGSAMAGGPGRRLVWKSAS